MWRVFYWLTDVSDPDDGRCVECELGSVPRQHIHTKLYLKIPSSSRMGCHTIRYFSDVTRHHI